MTLPKPIRFLLPIAVAAALIWFFVHRAGGSATRLAASGTVEATDAALGFPAGGRITEILVHEGDQVHAGQLLARLDSVEATARVQQARAQLAAARALLLELERGARSEEIDQVRSALEAAEHTLADADVDLARMKKLAAGQVVSRQALDKAQTAYDLAVDHRAQARAQLTLLEKGTRAERLAAQRAQVALAEAQLHSAEAAQDNLELKASFDGVVTVRHHEPGETVGPGAAVLTVMNPDDRWVRIYVPENRIGTVHTGQSASIRSDSWPGREFTGRVTYVATEAEFTPRNVQTQEERVKLVYAVKVRIESDSGLALRPGTPADVELAETPEPAS